ncbi:MAG: tetratricopeptide repeat protein [Pyrinomonadaceae bacterium]
MTRDRILINPAVAIRHVFAASLLCTVLFGSAVLCTFAQDGEDEPKNAVNIFNQGQEIHEKGDLIAAIKLYDEAIALVEDFPEAEYQKGIAYLALNKIDEAESSFRKATEKRPEWSLALAMLGDVKVRKHIAATESGDIAEAKRLAADASATLTKAIELDANNFPAYAALVDLQLHSAAPSKSLGETLTKLRILTDGKMKVPASIWSARAGLENAVGEKALARSSLKNALAVDPKNINAIKFAAELALNDHDTEQAESYTETLTKLAPDRTSTIVLQARVAAAQGKTDIALKLLDLIKVKSAEAESLRAGISASASTDTAKLEALVAKEPKNASYLGRLCVLNRLEAPDKALDYCRRASEAEPTNIDHAIGYGAALVQAKRFDQAAALLKRISEIAPENATVHANLAAALYQLKRYAEAKAEYRWIAAKMPDSAIAHYLLAVSHDQLAEYLDAMANYQQFLRLADPLKNQLEIEKVNLRVPSLQKQIKEMKVKKN